MPRFFILAEHGGAEGGIPDAHERQHLITEVVQSEGIGGQFVDLVWTAGAFDLLLIADFPDIDRAAACEMVLRSALLGRTSLLCSLDLDRMSTARDGSTAAAEALVAAAKPATGRPATGRAASER